MGLDFSSTTNRVLTKEEYEKYCVVSKLFGDETIQWEYKGLFKKVNYKHTIDKEKKTFYLMFEESSGMFDWIANLLAFPVKFGSESYKVHLGFYWVWASIKEDIEKLIDQTLENNEISEVVLFGWSHGGALAHFALRLLKQKCSNEINIEAYTIGSPRIVHSKSTDCFEQDFKGLCVIQNTNDMVTRVPFKIWGFKSMDNPVTVGDKFSLGKIFKPKIYHMKSTYDELLKGMYSE